MGKPREVKCAVCGKRALTCLDLPHGWELVDGAPRCRRCIVLGRMLACV